MQIVTMETDMKPKTTKKSKINNEEEVILYKKTIQGMDEETFLIFSNIENIYQELCSDKEGHPRYYKILRIFLFCIVLFNFCYFWILNYMISPMKNHFYCFDPFGSEFHICSVDDFCETTHYGINIIIFNESDKYSSWNTLNETININRAFLNFFLKDSWLFSKYNAKYDKITEVNTYYTAVIALKFNEEFSIFNCFNHYCEKQSMLIQLAGIILSGMIMGNIIFGYIADVYGRKKSLVMALLLQFIGGVLVFVITQVITSHGQKNHSTVYNATDQSFDFNYLNYQNITQFINQSYQIQYQFPFLNTDYAGNFTKLKQMHMNTDFVLKNFSKYKIFFFFGLFFIFISNAAIYNVALAHLLENSLNEDTIYFNYYILHLSMPLSIILSFILVTKLNSFHLPILIISCCMLILALLLILFTYESPRLHFEYFNYPEITRIMKEIKPLTESFKKNLLKDPTVGKFEKEIKNLKKAFQTTLIHTIMYRILFLGFCKKVSKRRQILRKDIRKFEREDIIRNPYHLYILFETNKQFSHHFLIIVSLIADIGLIHHIVLGKISSSLVFPREDLYNNIIVNTVTFFYMLVYCFSLYVSSFILKFFGFNILLLVSFFFIMVFALAYELVEIRSVVPNDLNIFEFNSNEVIQEQYGKVLLWLLAFVIFFSSPLYYALFFYITKLTKTVYRCSLYGFCHLILNLTILFSTALSQYFEKSFFYVVLFAIIGFVNTYFVSVSDDIGIITDHRQINFDANEDET